MRSTQSDERSASKWSKNRCILDVAMIVIWLLILRLVNIYLFGCLFCECFAVFFYKSFALVCLFVYAKMTQNAGNAPRLR